MAARSMTDNIGGTLPENLTESVEELRARLEAMKRLMETEEGEEKRKKRNAGGTNRECIIDGSFLSCVFIVVLVLIICVSAYAFYNLYHAVLKKFPSRQHTEL